VGDLVDDELLPRARDLGYDISRVSAEGEIRWRQTFEHDLLEFSLFGLEGHAVGDRAVVMGTLGVGLPPRKPDSRDIYLGWLDENGKLLRSDRIGSPDHQDQADGIAISGGRLVLAGSFAGPMRIGQTTLEPVPGDRETLMSVFLASFALQSEASD
jgi:hypothetical protein